MRLKKYKDNPFTDELVITKKIKTSESDFTW